MPVVYIKIIELQTADAALANSRLNVFTHSSEEKTVYKMKLEGKEKILICPKHVTFTVKSQKESSIFLDLKKHRFIIKDDIVGTLQLPLVWFPTNHIVREWFPMKENAEFRGGMVLLDVHVDNRGCLPFMAPFTTLRVLPAWQRPALITEHSDLPCNPPVVYILNQPQVVQSASIPMYIPYANEVQPNSPQPLQPIQQAQYPPQGQLPPLQPVQPMQPMQPIPQMQQPPITPQQQQLQQQQQQLQQQQQQLQPQRIVSPYSDPKNNNCYDDQYSSSNSNSCFNEDSIKQSEYEQQSQQGVPQIMYPPLPEYN